MIDDLSRSHAPVGNLLGDTPPPGDWQPYRLSREQLDFYQEHGAGQRTLSHATSHRRIPKAVPESEGLRFAPRAIGIDGRRIRRSLSARFLSDRINTEHFRGLLQGTADRIR